MTILKVKALKLGCVGDCLGGKDRNREEGGGVACSASKASSE